MAISNNLKDIRVERMAIRLAHYLNMSVEEIFKLDDATFRQQKIKE